MKRISAFGALAAATFSSAALADNWVIQDFGANQGDYLKQIRLGNDDRIFALVSTDELMGLDCGVHSLDATGSLIPTFGTGGQLPLPRTQCWHDLAVGPDNTTLIGDASASSGARLIVRDATGQITLSTATQGGVEQGLFAIARRADGKLVMAGRSDRHTNTSWTVWQWNADGSVDTTFGGGTVRFKPPLPDYSGASAIMPLSGGKLIVGGFSISSAPQLSQLNADGSIDFAFGVNGFTELSSATPNTLAIDSSEKIYGVGNATQSIKRFLSNGVVDATYIPSATPNNSSVQAIAVDSQDRAIVLSYGVPSGPTSIILTRLATDGTRDSSFGTNGEAGIQLPRQGIAPGCRLAIQSGDRPVVACAIQNVTDRNSVASSDLIVLRFDAGGLPDETFGAQEDADRFPDSYAFDTVSAPYSSANVQSSPVTISGINGPTNVNLFSTIGGGGAYSIGCNGTFTSQPGTISDGQTICVRQHAPVTPLASNELLVEVGGRRVSYFVTSTGVGADTIPSTFAFLSKTDVPQNVEIVSDPITISGIDGLAPVSIQNGRYSIGCSQTYRGDLGYVLNGQNICVLHTSSIQVSASVVTTLIVGGVSNTFTSTTAAAAPIPPPPTTTPPPPSSSTSPPTPVVSNNGGGGAWDYLSLLYSALALGWAAVSRFKLASAGSKGSRSVPASDCL